VESSCELGNEPSGSIKFWESSEWLHNLWPLEWYAAPQNNLYIIYIYEALVETVPLFPLPFLAYSANPV
jgi:hypothetical protein